MNWRHPRYILGKKLFFYTVILKMKISRRSKQVLLTLIALLLALGVILKLPQVTMHYAKSQFLVSAQAATEPKVFPSDFNIANIKTDYGAKGDGATDDTAAIQKALNDGRTEGENYYGKPKAIYLPAGTYLVSNTLTWNGCCGSLQGQGSQSSIIKLKDNAIGYSNPDAPKAVIKTPEGNMSFRQNIFALGVDVGKNNPGAIGIDYIANNTGTISNVTISSGDGKGKVGLDMSRQWPGPCLLKNIQIKGFDYGIYIKHAEYGPSFEHITLSNQKVAGIRNEGR